MYRKFSHAIAGALIVLAGAADAACERERIIKISPKQTVEVPITGTRQTGTMAPRICTWDIGPFNMGECQINGARVSGAGTKPEGSITVTRVSDGAQIWQEDPSGGNGTWYADGNSFNCATLGCGGGMYQVVSDATEAPLVCAQQVRIRLTVN